MRVKQAVPRRRVRLERVERGLRPEVLEAGTILRLDLEEQRVDLVSQPCGYRQRSFALGREQVQHRRDVFRSPLWEARRFLSDEVCYRGGVEAIGLVGLARSAPTARGPARGGPLRRALPPRT